MKMFKISGILAALALLLPACQTYQIGAAFEPRENAYAQGAFFTGDWASEHWEASLGYFPDAHPQDGSFQFAGGHENVGAGMDFLFKYPFHFLGNHLSVFPILGLDFRYYQPNPIIEEPVISDYIGSSIKFGGGLDYSFTESFFLRAKVLYSPDVFSFADNKGGVRYSLNLGYRTTDDDARQGFKTYRKMRQDTALKKAKENFDKQNYDDAIVNYRKAIGLNATLGNSGVMNFSTALYERAKLNQGEGDYRQALLDYNESFKHQSFMTRQKYSDWKGVVALYESTYSQNAPHGGYGKFIFPLNDNLTITYNRAINGLSDPNEISGSGWNLNMPAGRRTFDLTYNEPNFNRGYLKSDSASVMLDVEDGPIYEAGAAVSGSRVTITIFDVTNRELGKNLDIEESPLFSRTLALVEERPREENVTITIANNTGYSVYYMYISPADSDTWGDDVLNSTEILRNKASRRVALPPLNTARRYDIRLEDKDGDTYTKWGVTITQNATITFTIADIDF
jgi:tetratricopeptide (TPR) repeat protein